MIRETVKNAAKHCERSKGRKGKKRVLDRNYIQRQVQTTDLEECSDNNRGRHESC